MGEEHRITARPTPSTVLHTQMVGRGLRVPVTGPVTQTTRLSVNGSTSVVVTAPLPCGLEGCVGELHITSKHGDTQRVHLNAQQRRELILGLGGAAQ